MSRHMQAPARYVVGVVPLLAPLVAYALRIDGTVVVSVVLGAYPGDEDLDGAVAGMIDEMERTGRDRAWRTSAR